MREYLAFVEEARVAMRTEFAAPAPVQASAGAATGASESRLSKVVAEIVDTEADYVADLVQLHRDFIQPLSQEPYLSRCVGWGRIVSLVGWHSNTF